MDELHVVECKPCQAWRTISNVMDDCRLPAEKHVKICWLLIVSLLKECSCNNFWLSLNPNEFFSLFQKAWDKSFLSYPSPLFVWFPPFLDVYQMSAVGWRLVGLQPSFGFCREFKGFYLFSVTIKQKNNTNKKKKSNPPKRKLNHKRLH